MFKHNAQPMSVGVVGDGDDVSILVAFEDVFKVEIMDAEAESIWTLEDAHSVICSKLPSQENEQTKCLTAMACYRLKRAMQINGKANLSKRVEVPETMSPREFQENLEKGSGLKLPFLTTSSAWVNVIGRSILATWVAGPILLSGTPAVTVSVLLFVSTIVLWRFASSIDQRVLAFDGTLADLSRQASEENIGFLVSEGGKWDKTDVWTAMTKIISDVTGFPAERMRPSMTFIK